MMADLEPLKCTGCLSTNRKLFQILDVDKKKCFAQILSEISWQTASECNKDIWLCWECNGHISSYINFKRSVLLCHKVIHFYATQSKTTSLTIQPQPSLSYSPEQKEIEEEIFEVIRKESQIKNEFTQIKEEFAQIKEESVKDLSLKDEDENNIDDSFHDEDDVLLIEFSKKESESAREKKEKLINGVKKKKKRRKSLDTQKETAIYTEVQLDREDIEKERKDRESQEDYVNAMFKCDKCIITFPNNDDMVDHENVKHLLNASKFKCEICGCSFATEVSYNYHTNRHRRRYECVSCLERFHSKRAVERHWEIMHTYSTNLEPANGEILHNGTDVKSEQHTEEILKSKGEFPCEVCNKVFKWKTSLRKHAETHRIESGQKRRPYCEPCRLSFTTTANLQKHVRTSSKHQIQLKLRKLKESGEEVQVEAVKLAIQAARATHTCPHCAAAFQWRGNLRRHLLTHTARARGELVCTPCNRTFSSIATFTQHMQTSRRHVTENEFKYVCTDCGKKFANKTRLRDHMDWEHLKKYSHSCGECGKVFRSDTALRLHAQGVHGKGGGKDRLCDYCGRGFPNLGKLRTHISAVHSAQAAFCCAACGARFSWHSCLSRHTRRVHRQPTQDAS